MIHCSGLWNIFIYPWGLQDGTQIKTPNPLLAYPCSFTSWRELQIFSVCLNFGCYFSHGAKWRIIYCRSIMSALRGKFWILNISETSLEITDLQFVWRTSLICSFLWTNSVEMRPGRTWRWKTEAEMVDVKISHYSKRCSNTSCQRPHLSRACRVCRKLSHRVKHYGVPRKKPNLQQCSKSYPSCHPRWMCASLGKRFFFSQHSIFHFVLLAWALESVEYSQFQSAFFMGDFGCITLF